MDKKLNDSIIRINLIFLILSILAAVMFVVKVGSSLYRITCGGILYDVNFTIFLLKIYATDYHNNSTYIIFNYPLIPIGAAIIYNLFAMIKNNKEKLENK